MGTGIEAAALALASIISPLPVTKHSSTILHGTPSSATGLVPALAFYLLRYWTNHADAGHSLIPA
jgi:hypothetical protein